MRQVFFFIILLAGITLIQPANGQSTDPSPSGPQTDSLSGKSPLSGPGLRSDSVPGHLVHSKKDGLHTDSLPVKIDSIPLVSKKTILPVKDSTGKKKHIPRRATIYSAILPGAGQIYNGKYWKLPLVYAAVGIPVYFYFDNKKWYNKAQYALAVTINNSKGDSLARVDPLLVPFVNNGDVSSIITVRDEVRKNQDYSVLFFLLFYGLNIVDATVDAHLRDFNVNSDLSFKVKPMIIAGPGLVAGLSLVFDIHKGKPRPLNLN